MDGAPSVHMTPAAGAVRPQAPAALYPARVAVRSSGHRAGTHASLFDEGKDRAMIRAFTTLKALAAVRGRAVGAVVACIAMIAAVVAPPLLARAAEGEKLRAGSAQDYYVYAHDGQVYWIGVVGYDGEDRRYYCVEQPALTDYMVGPAVRVPDSERARRVAALLAKYQKAHNGDEQTQTALAIIVHDMFDDSVGANGWPEHRKTLQRVDPKVFERVDELLAEARGITPDRMYTRATYDAATRSGVVEVHIVNKDGDPVAGIPFTLGIGGAAVFDDGSTSVEAVSGDGAFTVGFRSTGDGAVRVTGSSKLPTLDRVSSRQDLIRLGAAHAVALDETALDVRHTFTPTIRTVAASKLVTAGDPVADDVTIDVAQGDAWPAGERLEARGWYFDGLRADELGDVVEPERGQDAQAFLDRLEQRGRTPRATAAASFDAPGASVRAQAMKTPEGDEPYLPGADAGFGTWVWVVERERQGERVRSMLKADVVTPFLEASETSSMRARPSVSSQAGEHTAHVGADLTDVIDVSGLPDDHGDFAGDERIGVGADEKLAEVRVWWSGDGAGGDDGPWRPGGSAEPAEDEHHHLVGSWTYPAANGRIRFGGGEPDASGTPVSVTADRPGWYVFVWRFAGDDRVEAAASAYDDAWERVRVLAEHERIPETPTLVTQVDPEQVKVGEPFLDAARVTGAVPQGAYVTFRAYEAVERGERPGAGGLLLDGAPVPVDASSRDQTVRSAQVRSSKAGLVYWQATLFGPEGDVLASHELGVPGEVVRVVDGAEPVVDRDERHAVPLATTGVSGVLPLTLAMLALAAVAVLVLRRMRPRDGS